MYRIAHRGASKYEAENSMAAFRKAVEIGVDFLEADVQFTRDGIAVIRHDKLLDRTTNLSGYVSDYSFEQLRKQGQLKNGAVIPSLDELAIYVASENVRLYIDLKTFGKEETLLNMLLAKLPAEKFIIGAFHSGVIQHLKQLNKAIQTVWIVEGNFINLEKEITDCGCDIVALGFDSIDEATVKKIQQLNKKVFTWTLDDPREIARAKAMGIDGITSNCPDLI